MKAVFAIAAAAAVISPSAAFAPSIGAGRVSSSLAATSDRRDAMNNIAKLVGGLIVTAGADPALAINNPALATFKRKPKTGGDGTYKPNQGMRAHESFDELVAINNPALATFKRKPKTGGDGTYKPNQGMRARLSFDDLC